MQKVAPNAPLDGHKKLASFGYAIKESGVDASFSFPNFPCDNLKMAAKIFQSNQRKSIGNLCEHLYPFQLLLTKENHRNVYELFDALNIEYDATRTKEQKITLAAKPETNNSSLISNGNMLD